VPGFTAPELRARTVVSIDVSKALVAGEPRVPVAFSRKSPPKVTCVGAEPCSINTTQPI
jgi:hypothetical protein